MSSPGHRLMPFFSPLLALALLLSATLASALPAPKLTGDAKETTNAGHVLLRWAEDVDAERRDYELQESTSANFAKTDTRYAGPDRASFISGLPDGTYYYRVRQRADESDAWSAWSNPKQVVVKYHSDEKAAALFAMGLVVFVITAGFLLRNRNTV